MPRATKIVATLGPASSAPEVLERLLLAGVDVVRLNFSHGKAQDHIDRANLVRAVVEGVAFNLYTGLEAFTSTGATITSIDAIGGAANSAPLLQIFSDVWGLPIRRRALVDEATALGAAVVGEYLRSRVPRDDLDWSWER
mgnify:CR=1 FL=1